MIRNRLVERERPLRHQFNLIEAESDVSDLLIPLEAGISPDCFTEVGTDRLAGLDVELEDRLPTFFDDEVIRRWSAERLCDSAIIDSNAKVAESVRNARELMGLNILTLDETTNQHGEALDFTVEKNIELSFFYLNDLLHRRRAHMIADVVALKVVQIVSDKGHAVVLDIGPGLSVVSRATIDRLDPEVRKHVSFTAVDVSDDLLRYGCASGWLDQGVVADLSTLDARLLEDVIGKPDVVIAAEVLEHIPGSAAVFARTTLPWLRDCGSYFIGTVPNAVQGAELLRMANAEAAPHQLSRHLVDETTGHVAFYTYATLRSALENTWQLSDPVIWSNGLRLDATGSALCFDAALRFPHRGDRLCFAGQC